ncbi:MAG: hypothetical protein QHH04_08205 [Methanolinea sp.]|nr:hypothetical protein [Methanolinea sp.]
MVQFPYTFRFDGTTLSLEPVTVRSRIVWGKDRVRLKEKYLVSPVAGSGWEDLVTITDQRFIDDQKAYQFSVSIGSLTLREFAKQVLGRRPVMLQVTLFPDMALPIPTMGVPVPAQGPALTDTVGIAIPEIPAGFIEYRVDSSGPASEGVSGCLVFARVRLPPFVILTEKEALDILRSVSFSIGSVDVAIAGEEIRETWKVATVVPSGPGAVDRLFASGELAGKVYATALVAGTKIMAEIPLTILMQRGGFIALWLSKGRLVMDGRDTLTVAAMAVPPGWSSGNPVPDAYLGITANLSLSFDPGITATGYGGWIGIAREWERCQGTWKCWELKGLNIPCYQNRDQCPHTATLTVSGRLPGGPASRSATIGLDHPSLSIEPGYLAFRSGSTDSARVTATVVSTTRDDWTIEASFEPGEGMGNSCVSINPESAKGPRAEFTVQEAEKNPKTSLSLDTATAKGRLTIVATDSEKGRLEGSIGVTLAREGIYLVEDRISPGDVAPLPIRGDIPPGEKGHGTPARFVYLWWNSGEGRLDADAGAAGEGALEFSNFPESPEKQVRDAFIRIPLEKVFRGRGEKPVTHAIWELSAGALIPGKGQVFPAALDVWSTSLPQFPKKRLPLAIVFDSTPPCTNKEIEYKNCVRIVLHYISDPATRTGILTDLDIRKKHLDARDLCEYRKAVWEKAYQILYEEGKSWQNWDYWLSWAELGCKTVVFLADRAFQATAYANFGPQASLFVSIANTYLREVTVEIYHKPSNVDYETLFSEFCNRKLVEIQDMIAVTIVDSAILHEYNPSEPYWAHRLAVLFIWKVAYHWSRGKRDTDEGKGIIAAVESALLDVATMSFDMLAGEFIRQHARGKGMKTYLFPGETPPADRGGGKALVRGAPQKPEAKQATRKKAEPSAEEKAILDTIYDILLDGVDRNRFTKDQKTSFENMWKIMERPDYVRILDEFGRETFKTAFDNTRREFYGRTDPLIVDWIKNNVPGMKEKDIRILEFGTPGAKPGEKLNTDRDFRAVEVLQTDAKGNPTLVRELKRTIVTYKKGPDGKYVRDGELHWDIEAYKIIAREAGVKNWNDPAVALDHAAQHQQLATDYLHPEASLDYSDQLHVVKDGKMVISGESNVVRVTAGGGKLLDPKGIADMFHTKVHDAAHLFPDSPGEAYKQASKACTWLEKIRAGYQKQNYDIGTVPEPVQKGMEIVQEVSKRPWDKGAVAKADAELKKLGFRDVVDFTDKLGEQFEWLRIARKG